MPVFFRRPSRYRHQPWLVASRWLGVLGFAVTAAIVTCPTLACAEEAAAESSADALKRARDQFGQALSLQTAGDWAGALSLLKEVAAVKSTPQVRFNMAICEEKLGRLIAALGDYELAAADARAEKADLVAEEVEGRLEALRRRIPKITVRRGAGAGAEAATFALDGVSLGDQVIDTPMPVDPGPHTIEAKAPGFKGFRKSVRVVEQQSETVEVVLEAEAVVAAGDSVAPRAQPLGRSPVSGYVIGGLGIASLGASGAFFALRASKISELDKECPERKCPTDQQSTIDQGKLYTTIANVTLAVGAAAVAGGLVLVLTSGPSSEPSVALAPSLGGAQLYGAF